MQNYISGLRLGIIVAWCLIPANAIGKVIETVELTAEKQTTREPTESRPMVIVHGAWGGAHHWKTVAAELQKQSGQVVYRATLTGLGERSHLLSRDVDLNLHIQDVRNLISFEDLENVVLIGHSYGGAVISGVADAIPDKVSHLLYFDAHLLLDGETMLTHHPDKQKTYVAMANEGGDGWYLPVASPNIVRDVPHPLATLQQPIQLPHANQTRVPGAYWLFIGDKTPADSHRHIYYQRAADRNWETKTFPWAHNPHRDRPNEVVAELIKFLQRSKQRQSATVVPAAK